MRPMTHSCRGTLPRNWPDRAKSFRHHVRLALAIVLACGFSAQLASAQTPTPRIDDYEIVARYPHAADAFCQGLEFAPDGTLYEGTGLYGQSTLRRVDLESGRVLRSVPLERNLFGEGITIWNDRIYQLTWTSRVGLIYDLKSMRLVGRFRYTGEGWGLTHDDKHLILSDGTSELRFLDPETFEVVRRLQVKDGNRLIDQVNELEYIKGEIYANLWNSSYIIRIDPKTGKVLGWIDLRSLEPSERYGSNSVLNGIAYDPKADRLFVTGKNWSEMFHIRLVPRTASN